VEGPAAAAIGALAGKREGPAAAAGMGALAGRGAAAKAVLLLLLLLLPLLSRPRRALRPRLVR